MTQHPIALVLGATGGIGGEMAHALLTRGWSVRALHRTSTKPALGIEWIQGDAMRRDDVIAAATGTSLIVHGVNPAGYRNWAGLAPPMLDNTIAAAKASGARVFFPGTVYNFGPGTFPLVAEDAPRHPTTRKGAIRVQMEDALRQAANDGVKTLILRAGDFFGPTTTGNSWINAAMIKPGRPLTSITYPGQPETGHAWAYLPDVAETAMRLIERAGDLPDFATFHFGGHWFDRGIEIADLIRAAAGDPILPIRRFPWWLIHLGSPFVETFREMREMTYLWKAPLRLDNRRLIGFLGEEPHTPAIDAMHATLRGLGCLKAGHDQNRSAPQRLSTSALLPAVPRGAPENSV